MTDAAAVVAVLAARGETVATCESLTAGLVAATLADVPGASAVLRGGLVTYATELKHVLAGVPREVLAPGVVRREVALAMARGARERCSADWGVATTGVAGPGPADGVSAGTAWLAVVGPVGEVAELLERSDLARNEMRRECVQRTLQILSQALLNCSRL